MKAIQICETAWTGVQSERDIGRNFAKISGAR